MKKIHNLFILYQILNLLCTKDGHVVGYVTVSFVNICAVKAII